MEVKEKDSDEEPGPAIQIKEKDEKDEKDENDENEVFE